VRGPAGSAVRPRPSGKRGGAARKKKNGPQLGRKAGWAGSDEKKNFFFE
jgi:hypothetical protein